MLMIKIDTSEFFEPIDLRHSIIVGWSSYWGFLTNILLKKFSSDDFFCFQAGEDSMHDWENHCHYHLGCFGNNNDDLMMTWEVLAI